MKPSEIFFGLLKIPVDFALAIAALTSAYRFRATATMFRKADLGTFPVFEEFLVQAAVGALILLIINAMFRLYTLRGALKLNQEIGRVLGASLVWLMVAITYYFFIRDFPFSRLVLIGSACGIALYITTGRIIIRAIQRLILRAGIGKKRIAFIGDSELTQRLCGIFKKNPAYTVCGIIEKISLDELKIFVQGNRIEELIQTKESLQETESADILQFCREHHVDYTFVPSLLEMQRRNIEIMPIDGIPLLRLRPTPLDGWGKVAKRSFDFMLSATTLILFSPMLLAISLAIKITSPGTVFFKYLDDGSPVKRVGQFGRLFRFYKFRTMRMGTHNLRYTELAKQNLREEGPLVKIENDPRVTPVGRLLRKTSLDELPQLWNVLRGHMSLVGPRPHFPEEVAKYKNHHRRVFAIKPGITGLAQISGRSDLPFEEEVRLDTWYIEHWSPILDLKILWKTLSALVKGYKAD